VVVGGDVHEVVQIALGGVRAVACAGEVDATAFDRIAQALPSAAEAAARKRES